MNDSFTTGLYIFSSLLQADAAILGLGAVFVVYRLQSLYSQQSAYIDILQKSTIQGVPQACQTILEGDPEKVSTELKNFKGDRYHPLLKFLAEMDKNLKTTRTGLIPSLYIVALHCILSAFCLWWMSYLDAATESTWIRISTGIIVIFFAFVLVEIITAAQVTLVSKPFI